ncbi:hypothetical protein M2352_003016 [Azospirillum fermentarium]|uniref:hypothetical protein n=1 Tax=Azospirillum fermentarium TaxID=1233114 RepID=UPI00222682E6|nr:hypothetical protein [Azospirillum fermentarium]MCW2247382.1 hypothetical protein [Azospirillum fermentarium]
MLTALRQARIPDAIRIDGQRLLSMLGIPLAAGLAMAAAVAVTGPDRMEQAGGAVPFVLDFVRFCYLAVGSAHLAAAAAERVNGGQDAGIWLNGGDDATAAGGHAFWTLFPNHIDAAAAAFAMTLATLWIG